ncbi:hypothetical protein NHX12_018305 [Muraenolepis orangiensis]|uniref:Uncharacterized protein n=1 Tax=Muraenolepis orangiensis TaxID=630683 RepID=A0A9Q0EZ18_9TELE|nr:hypothetical protein NHX12_018305 [Muraenolepis orangiensis]
MSDIGVSPHMEGSRSFEVEDVDTTHSPGSRRNANSPHRNAMSPTSIYYRDLGTTTAAAASNSNNHTHAQPRSIMGGGGSKTPEPVSRRSELSIDISSSSSSSSHATKQLDNITSPGSARYVGNSGIKRPEVLGHSKSSDLSAGHKREVTFAKALPGDPLATRRNNDAGSGNNNNNNDNGGNNGHSSARTAEQNHHHARSPGDARRPEISLTRAPPAENNGHHHPHHAHHPNPHPHHHNTIVTTFRCSSPGQAGRKSPNPTDSK